MVLLQQSSFTETQSEPALSQKLWLCVCWRLTCFFFLNQLWNIKVWALHLKMLRYVIVLKHIPISQYGGSLQRLRKQAHEAIPGYIRRPCLKKLYVCTHILLLVYMCVCMCVCPCTFISIYVICVYTYTYVLLLVYMCVCVYTHLLLFIYVYVCIPI